MKRAAALAALAAVVALAALLLRPGVAPPTTAAAPSPAPGAWEGAPGQLTLVIGDTGGPGDLPGRGTEARLGSIAAILGEPGGSLVYAPGYGADLVRIAADGTFGDVFPEGIRLVLPRQAKTAGDAEAEPLSRHASLSALAATGDGGYFAASREHHVVLRIERDGLARIVAGRLDRRGLRDGPAGTSLLDGPAHLALARDGSLYIVDELNTAIRRLRPDGRLETFYRGRADRRGGVSHPDPSRPEPGRIAIDGEGFLWMIGRFEPGVGRNHAVHRLDARGRIDRTIGVMLEPGEVDGEVAVARFNAPYDLASDARGDLWLSEWGGHAAVRRISPQGQVVTVARSPCAEALPCTALTTAWRGPLGAVRLGLGGEQPFFAGDRSAIYRLEADGRVLPFAGLRSCEPPTGGERAAVCLAGIRALAQHPDGALIAVDGESLRRIETDGRTRTLVRPDATIEPTALPPQVAASGPGYQPHDPVTAAAGRGLAVDRAGRIYYGLAAEGIGVREPDGRLRLASHPTLVADDDPYPALMRIQGLGLLADGRLAVIEEHNMVRRIDPSTGRAEALAGAFGESGDRDGPGAQARFTMPRDLAVAPDGSVEVVDQRGLRQVRPDGTVATVGADPASPETDGCGWSPHALAIAPDGTRWFATFGPPRVWRMRPGAAPEWIAGDRRREGVRPGPLPGALAPVRALLPTADGGVLIASGTALLKALPAAAPAPRLSEADAAAAPGCGRG